MGQAEIIGYIILALSTIIGLYWTVCKPMLTNQKVMTELTCTMRELGQKLINFENHNRDSHKRIHERIDEHDEILQNHEIKLHDLERQQNMNRGNNNNAE